MLQLYGDWAVVLVVQFVQINAEAMLVKQVGCSMDKLEFHCIFAFRTTRKGLIRKQGDFMRKTVGIVNDAVNAALGNQLAGTKEEFLPTHATGI